MKIWEASISGSGGVKPASILLTWLGARSVESPYIILGQLLSVIYFLYYLHNISPM